MQRLGETMWEGHLPARVNADLNLSPGNQGTYGTRPRLGARFTFLGRSGLNRSCWPHLFSPSVKRCLARFGGHIGYEVKRHVGGKALPRRCYAFCSITPACKELDRVLLTCAPDNIAQ